MNAPSPKLKTVEQALAELPKPEGLVLLRVEFPPHQISKLPKETKTQAEQRKKDQDAGKWPAKCDICEGFHHPRATHLDYVGHAALTDRLLDVDPAWSWEPVALTEAGLPAFDQSGGLWIRLTVLGVSRLGYGHAKAKPNQDPGAREKEVIGDALRNAAMRFGAALDLWHKGDLHAEDDEPTQPVRQQPKADPVSDGTFITQKQQDDITALAGEAKVSVKAICGRYGITDLDQLHADSFTKCVNQLQATIDSRKQPADIIDDSIPY